MIQERNLPSFSWPSQVRRVLTSNRHFLSQEITSTIPRLPTSYPVRNYSSSLYHLSFDVVKSSLSHHLDYDVILPSLPTLFPTKLPLFFNPNDCFNVSTHHLLDSPSSTFSHFLPFLLCIYLFFNMTFNLTWITCHVVLSLRLWDFFVSMLEMFHENCFSLSMMFDYGFFADEFVTHTSS